MADEFQLQEAIQALRSGDRAQARHLLTELIKTDQNNASYWIWMSATVDTQKERIYCLQTALRIDPGNSSARRGLVLLGAIPPEEDTQPFPLQRGRSWADDLVLTHEQPRPKGMKNLTGRPGFRLTAWIGLGALIFVLIGLGLYFPGRVPLLGLITPGSSSSYTSTPTSIAQTAVIRTATPTFVGPTPLAWMLPATYTPTALYVSTPRQIQSSDIYRAARGAYQQGDWAGVVSFMQQVAALEPGAADPYYYIGEAYRFSGQYAKALEAYSRAINLNPLLGPAYLGRARVSLLVNPDADIMNDLDAAVSYSPDFAEAYLERGLTLLRESHPAQGLADLKTAQQLAPDSPLVQYTLAQAYLQRGQYEEALNAALQANQLDLTMLPVYLVMGQAYQALGQMDQAVGALQTYVLYNPDDVQALTLLAEAYNASGDFQSALQVSDRAVHLDGRASAAFTQRGYAYLGLGELDLAREDFERSLALRPRTFEPSIGLTRLLYLQGDYGDAYIQAERSHGFALDDAGVAESYYYAALCLEKLNDTRSAYRYWRDLLTLPSEAVSEEMRAEATQHMAAIRTPTPTRAPTPTRTPKP